MLKKMVNQRYIIVLLLLVYGVFTYMLNSFIPYISDDFYYRFVRMYYFDQEVASFGDVIESQSLHYQNINGRSVVHALLQTMLMLSPEKILFNLCNSVVFLLFIGCIVKIATPQRRSQLIYWLLAIIGAQFLLPESSYLRYWASGSFNYFWVSVIAAGFLFLYRRAKHGWDVSLWALPFFFIFSLLIGWLHESLMLGVWVALVIEMVCDKRCRARLPIIMFAGLTCGLFILMIAPGNYVRLEIVSSETGSLISHILQSLFVLSELRLSWILIAVMLWEVWRHKSRIWQYICDRRAFYVIWIVGLIFSVVMKFANRALFYVELMALILLIGYLPYFFEILKLQTQKILSITILILLVGYESVVGFEMNKLGNQVDVCLQEYRSSTKDYVVTPEWEPCGLVRNSVESPLSFFIIYNHYSEIYASHRMFRILPERTYQAIVDGELFEEQNRLEGELPFYTTDSISCAVMPCSDYFEQMNFDEFMHESSRRYVDNYMNGCFSFHCHPVSMDSSNVSLLGRVRRIFFPTSYPQEEAADNYYSINNTYPYMIEGEKYIILRKPEFRRIKSVKYRPLEEL